MTRAAVVVIALLLTGCVMPLPRGAERPPRESDLAVVDSVIARWRAAGEPFESRCREERASRMVVIRADQETMTSTGYCASRGPCCGTAEKRAACGCTIGCAAGATTWESDIVDPLAAITGTYRVMIWVSAYEDEQTQRRVIAHEATHWLGRACMPNGRRDVDATHARYPERWGSTGYESAGW